MSSLHPELQRTALYQLHMELGAKMVPFAGYLMPVQYPAGIITEHHHTRNKASLFDVSHMGQVKITGKPVAQLARLLEKLVPSDISALQVGRQRYTVFTNGQGGIEDDLIVANLGDNLYLVVNAANKHADYEMLQKKLGADCQVTMLQNMSLLALQGPIAADILQRLGADLRRLPFMGCQHVELASIPCFVARSGYTGEDGFEIAVANKSALTLAKLLLNFEHVKPAGLGARDTLRLEAGLCLHGQDITSLTTPVQAGLEWVISKNRRQAQGFQGSSVILEQLTKGTQDKLVGLKLSGRLPARQGSPVLDQQGQIIGTVTSGTFSPTLEQPIALGYINQAFSKSDQEVIVQVRDQKITAIVTKLPFVSHRYYRI